MAIPKKLVFGSAYEPEPEGVTVHTYQLPHDLAYRSSGQWVDSGFSHTAIDMMIRPVDPVGVVYLRLAGHDDFIRIPTETYGWKHISGPDCGWMVRTRWNALIYSVEFKEG